MRVTAGLFLLIVLAGYGLAQQAAPAPAARGGTQQEFLRVADEVLAEVSKHVALPLKTPLKKSLRSRAELRAFIEQQVKEEDPAEIYADERALEKFGLLPKGMQLLPFLLDLLEEQVAGLYDPKAQEFYIADWLEPAEEVLAVRLGEVVAWASGRVRPRGVVSWGRAWRGRTGRPLDRPPLWPGWPA